MFYILQITFVTAVCYISELLTSFLICAYWNDCINVKLMQDAHPPCIYFIVVNNSTINSHQSHTMTLPVIPFLGFFVLPNKAVLIFNSTNIDFFFLLPIICIFMIFSF